MIADRNGAQAGKRLSRPLNPAACFSGSSEFVASWQGKKFSAPCRFIYETIAQLRGRAKPAQREPASDIETGEAANVHEVVGEFEKGKVLEKFARQHVYRVGQVDDGSADAAAGERL